ncbi:hypothetical protein HHI36_010229 [Cryptolaemus montrouzieri]|uniref:Uncharacterized protein n=1 Tax=Cryptolaemus montrouzieri TaxID=559131 RepID=A0ABD2MI96_9CUCU
MGRVFGEMVMKTQCSVRLIFHINIRNIEKNYDELRIFLQNTSEHFQVIVLSQTFYINDPNIFHIKEYPIVYNEGRYNNNDAVLVYVAKQLEYDYENSSVGEVEV